MTKNDLSDVFEKTRGHCHFCGDELSRSKYGRSGDRSWRLDHVIQKKRGGADSIDNFLPICTTCNRARWHYRGAALRHLLRLGQAARELVRSLKPTDGIGGIRLRPVRTTHKRKGDPIQREWKNQRYRLKLLRVLKSHRGEEFTPAELAQRADVPKRFVRRVLEPELGCDVYYEGRKWRFVGWRKDR
jgi:hypothetical protein